MKPACAPPLRRCGVAALCAVLALLGACGLNQVEPIAAPPGTRAEKITGFRTAEAPPDPRVGTLAVADLEASLRRVVVRYTRFTVFFQTDPMPLLSEQQISAYAQILADELPRLTGKQKLRFTFADRRLGRTFEVEMDVYREGIYLVYRFGALAQDRGMGMGDTYSPFMARLDPQPGQEVVSRDDAAWVKDPLLADVREAATAAGEKRALLDAALKEAVAEKGETQRLEALLARPAPGLDAWKTYWDKRRTLKKALDQNLLDRAAYQAQAERLTAELER